jgi:hypothetical protein
MDSALYYMRYREDVLALALSMEGIIRRLRTARKSADLQAIKNQMLMMVRALDGQADRWQDAAVAFMAGEEWAPECAFHFLRYSDACSMCQRAKAQRAEVPV